MLEGTLCHGLNAYSSGCRLGWQKSCQPRVGAHHMAPTGHRLQCQLVRVALRLAAGSLFMAIRWHDPPPNPSVRAAAAAATAAAACMSTQKVHPANPSTIQSCDSPKLGTCALFLIPGCSC
mgnify:CR=1 FL=1